MSDDGGFASGTPRDARWRAAAGLVIVLATSTCFRGSLENQFVEWDDHVAIVGNPHIRELSAANLRWMFTTFHLGPYQPLAWLSLAADFSIWGLQPRGFHLTSLVFHVTNALLVFWLALQLLAIRSPASRQQRSGSGIIAGALWSALFFALHPLRVESVAWATERRDLLCGCFTLMAMVCWVARLGTVEPGYSERPGNEDRRRRTVLYVASLVSFILALLSKASVMGLPLALLALDVLVVRRLPFDSRKWITPPHRDRLIEKLPFVAVAIVLAGVALYGQREAGAIRTAGETSYAWRIGTSVYAAGFYLAKLAWPLGLSPLYEASPHRGNSLALSIASGVLLLVISAVCLALARRRAGPLAAWLCYLLMLAPVSGIVPIGSHVAADRYTYISCLPWAILGGAALSQLLESKRLKAPHRTRLLAWGAIATGGAVLVICGVLTVRQVRVWESSYTLWDHAIHVDPASAIAHYGRAIALAGAGRDDEAIADYLEAVRLKPDYSDARNNLGVLLATRGQLDQAEEHFAAAERALPNNAVAQFNLGIIAGKRGNLREAEGFYRRALALRKGMVSARLNLAQIFIAGGQADSARVLLQDGLALAPNDSALTRALRSLNGSR